MLRSIILLLCLAALATGQDTAAPEWRTFAPKSGGFAILFPGSPNEQKQTVRTPTGNLEVTLFVFEPRQGDGRFLVSYSEYQEGALKAGTEERRLDNARDGMLASAKGKLVSEKRIDLDRHPGRELLIEVEGKGLVRTRIFAVKSRLYQTMVVGPRPLVEQMETTKFLDSFKLTK